MTSAILRAGWHQLRQRSLVVALVVFFGAVYTQYALKIKHSDHGMRSALLRWKTQLEDLDHGVNVWEKYAYPNPPIMALILKPFVQLPPALGASLWFGCKALLALASILGVLSLLDSPECPFPRWGKALAVLLSLRPIEGDLVHGNVNLLILFLIVASCWAFCRRCDSLAGMFLGLSIACKLTPALFLLYFLWKGAWKSLFAAGVSLAAFILFVPAVAFGWSNNLEFLRSWHHQMVAPYAAGIVTSEHKNQSLPGLLHRMLSAEASFSDYVGDDKVVLEMHNVVSWDRDIVQAIVVGCMALFALLALRFCRASIKKRPRRQTSEVAKTSEVSARLQFLAEFSVVVLGMLLFCERTWKHHCVTLLLPFGALAYCLSAGLFSRGVRLYLGITAMLVALLMLSTSTGVYDQQIDAPNRLGKLAQVYGAYVWAFLLLLASMFVILWQTTRRSQHVERSCNDAADAGQLAGADDGGAARPGRPGGKSQDDAGCVSDEPQLADDRIESKEQSRSAHEPE